MAGQQRFFDPSQPQTLQIATFLLYFDAAILVLRGGLFSPIGLLLVAGFAGGGYGIANTKKWGYALAVAVAMFGLVTAVLARTGVIDFVLAAALVGLLLHPMSREYQRIWFS